MIKFLILVALFILWQACTYIAYKHIHKKDKEENNKVPDSSVPNIDIVIPVDPSINDIEDDMSPVFLEKYNTKY